MNEDVICALTNTTLAVVKIKPAKTKPGKKVVVLEFKVLLLGILVLFFPQKSIPSLEFFETMTN